MKRDWFSITLWIVLAGVTVGLGLWLYANGPITGADIAKNLADADLRGLVGGVFVWSLLASARPWRQKTATAGDIADLRERIIDEINRKIR